MWWIWLGWCVAKYSECQGTSPSIVLYTLWVHEIVNLSLSVSRLYWGVPPLKVMASLLILYICFFIFFNSSLYTRPMHINHAPCNQGANQRFWTGNPIVFGEVAWLCHWLKRPPRTESLGRQLTLRSLSTLSSSMPCLHRTHPTLRATFHNI